MSEILYGPCGNIIFENGTMETHQRHMEFITNNDISLYDILLVRDSLFENISFSNIDLSCTKTWLNCSVGEDGIRELH